MRAVRLYPIGETLRLSLHRWNILSKNKPFIGLDNFRELIGDPQFREACSTPPSSPFGVLIVTIPTALALAALIYHRTQSRLAGFYETAVFLPHVVSLVPAALAWKWIFDARLGPLNALLSWFGVAPKAWLFDPDALFGLHHRAVRLAGARLRRADLPGRIQEPAAVAVRGRTSRWSFGPASVSAICRSRC